MNTINWRDHIEQREGVMLGKPVFVGTRLTVEHILGALATGMSQDELFASYPNLKADHIRAAIQYDNEMRRGRSASQWGDGPVDQYLSTGCAGALADEWTDEDDRILAEIYRGRHPAPQDSTAEPRIVATPGVRGGKPRLDGHRITVADVATWYERLGMSPDEICSTYPTLNLAEVHTALAYYYGHKAEIDRQIKEDEDWVEEYRAGAPSVFEKLGRARG